MTNRSLMNFVWRDAYKDTFPEDVFIEKEGRLNKKVENFNNEMKNDYTLGVTIYKQQKILLNLYMELKTNMLH